MQELKKCSICGLEKSLDFFQFRKDNNKYRNECNECLSLYQKEYRLKNKETITQKQKISYQKNKESILSQKKDYYSNNRENILEYKKQYGVNNRSKTNEYRRARYNDDIEYRLKKSFSIQIRRGLKSVGEVKNKKCSDYLDRFYFNKLKLHIESLFESWMNWNNQGKYDPSTWKENDSETWTWNIDHIIPHCEFKYKSMDDFEFRKCWALSNLRPISSKENILKSNKISNKLKSETLRLILIELKE